jgi:hypothetical protein
VLQSADARLGLGDYRHGGRGKVSYDPPPSEFELVVAKGAVLEARTKDGRSFHRGGNTLQLGQTKRPLQLRVRATGDVPMECVGVSMSNARLRVRVKQV